LPQVPVSVVQVSVASTDTSGADEWDLDTQMSSGMAQTLADLYLYDNASMTDADTALGFNLFASQDVAQAGSASFGICEFLAYLDGSMLADDQVFEEAAAQGQTVFSSTGDTGPSCAVVDTNGVPDTGLPFMSYPAVSPYVVAVGGTDLFVNQDGSYNTEIAWEAGGGGISQLESSPYWQAAAVPSNALGDKGVPDVAMDAALETGALVYIGGVENMVGGTSLASPLALGSWARLQSAHGNGLGFAAPKFYGLTAGLLTPASGFHDVIAGCNGLYCATPGWDFTTGLGSFDISSMGGLLSP
jgi:subtilase family serine protease